MKGCGQEKVGNALSITQCPSVEPGSVRCMKTRAAQGH